MTDRRAEDQTPQTSQLDVTGADQQDSIGTVNPGGLESDPDQDELEELRADLWDVTHEEKERLEGAREEEQ